MSQTQDSAMVVKLKKASQPLFFWQWRATTSDDSPLFYIFFINLLEFF
jgi:hypothetical protein